MTFRALFVAAVICLSGCAIVPDPLQVSDDKALVGYSKAVIASDDAIGKQARWGGVITSVVNKDNKTTIEMVYFPLNHYAKPIMSQQTPGRFKAVINNFVDPIVFKEGRLATFVGTIAQPMAGLVGEQAYMFPSMIVEDYHLWRNQRPLNTNSLFFDFYGGWFSPFYSRFWGPWGIYHPGFRGGWGLGVYHRPVNYAPVRQGLPGAVQKPQTTRSQRSNRGTTRSAQTARVRDPRRAQAVRETR